MTEEETRNLQVGDELEMESDSNIWGVPVGTKGTVHKTLYMSAGSTREWIGVSWNNGKQNGYAPEALASWTKLISKQENTSNEIMEPSQPMTVKIDYVQFPCPKCGTPMKALWDLNNQYCPNGCR